jgi:hypothetical protein
MTKTAAAKAAPKDPPAAPEAEAVPEKPVVALLASEFRPRESGVYFNTYEAVPAKGTPLEHLLLPAYWANVSQKLRPGGTILAFSSAEGFYAELLVWDAGQNWAHVDFKGEPMQRPRFSAPAGVLSDFRIMHHPIKGICVERISSGEVVKANFPNHEDARKWMIDNQAALRR